MMLNRYDFLNLSYVEFEEMCKDLLEKEWNLNLQSFGEGADEGVDLRAYTGDENQIIVQCKRYKDYSSLVKAVKLEIPKLSKLGCSRYVLTTSVNLTKDQHKKLEILLDGFVTNPLDIMGNKYLNGLLRKFRQVEDNHFKLWIQGTGVLERILHSTVVNHSQFEMETIEELLKYYVVNPSFDHAIKILERNRFVIISGIPGIGKTTLARVLSFQYLSKRGYDQFVYLSGSIDAGFRLFKEGVKQVFLYDDFLGKSFDERRLERNEDKRIVDFIKQIRRSHDKILLFTTREYVLQDVQQKYETLNDPDIDLSKCIIDLQTYSPLVKARIFYQHLFFSGLPVSHLTVFSHSDNYNKVVKHKNYSPRVIENVIRQFVEMPGSEEQFLTEFISSLDNPYRVWEKPFTSQISDFSRWMLTILLTMGTPVLEEDLQTACRHFSNIHGSKYFPIYSNALYNNAFKELEGSFLLSHRDGAGQRIIRYENPSVQDFLLYYFDRNKDLLFPVVQSAIFMQQLFGIFSNKKSDKEQSFLHTKLIEPDRSLNETRFKTIISELDKLESCSLTSIKYSGEDESHYIRSIASPYIILYNLSNDFRETDIKTKVDEFVISKFQELIHLPDSESNSNIFKYYTELLKLYREKLTYTPDMLVRGLAAKMNYLFMFHYYFRDIAGVFPDEFNEYIESVDFKDRIQKLIKEEMKTVKTDWLNTLIANLEAMEELYGISTVREQEILQKRYKEEVDNEEGHGGASFDPEKEKENTDIETMFASLLLV
jgi:hypothetical protein